MGVGPDNKSINGLTCAIAPRPFALAILFVCFWACPPASAQIGWYATEEIRCDGMRSLAEPLRDGGLLAPDMDIVATAPATGKVHVRLDVADLRAVTAADGTLILDSRVLDANSSPRFRELLLRQEREVPWLATAFADLLTGYVTHAATKLAAEGLFEWLVEKQRRPSISVKDAAFLVAQGGTLQTVLAVYQSPDKRRRAVYTTMYTVQVGSETRTVMLYSCRYAVETKVAQFQTLGTSNNKIVRPDGARWRVLDVDTNKYDRAILVYEDQDEEYFYFGLEGELEKRRISFKGGPWQLLDKGEWKTLYAQVDAH
jgi:hypothetical protein